MESCIAFLTESTETKKFYTVVLKYLFNILDYIFAYNKNRLLQGPQQIDFTQEFEKMKGLDLMETL